MVRDEMVLYQLFSFSIPHVDHIEKKSKPSDMYKSLILWNITFWEWFNGKYSHLWWMTYEYSIGLNFCIHKVNVDFICNKIDGIHMR